MRREVLLAAATAAVQAFVATPYDTLKTGELIPRALPANAPNGYTPQTVDCPSTKPTIRDASTLSDEELEWLPKRRNETLQPMMDFLGRMNITGLDTDQYIQKHKNNASALPNIGIAVSGGGYRAMLNGAGHIQAWDSRTPGSTESGQLGGLLQSATYLSGLSGGSWLVGSLYSNNFTSVDKVLSMDTPDDKSGDVWQLGNSIFVGPESDGIQLLDSIGYYASLLKATNGKSDAGFDTTITDIWGRALSYQLVNATDGGPAYTWSSLAKQDFITDGSAPLPLIVADSRAPGEKLVSSNTTVFVFSPWELGSYDPTVYGFAPLQYVGTNFTNGKTTSDKCVEGFDNVGFVMGTSSSLFNNIITTVDATNTTGKFSGALQSAIVDLLSDVGKDNDDIADYPNPFYKYNTDTNTYASSRQLTLVDGGEDGQNVPLNPLIQPLRSVDVIFAVDSSADTNTTWPTSHSSANWPNGASLVATYERSLSSIQNHTAFPSIPDINTFVNKGLNKRPTFFGCSAANLTGPAPLIVYIPNAPYVYASNTSTFDMSYNDTERNAMVLNAYNGATQGNGTLDSEWGTCVGCAILSRSLDRTGTDVPEVCSKCFDKYCWDGETDDSVPGDYVPTLMLPDDEVSVKDSGVGRLVGSVGWAVVAALGVLMA